MRKAFLLPIICCFLKIGVSGQEARISANFQCEEVDIECLSVSRQEFAIVISAWQFNRLFPQAKRKSNERKCPLPAIDFSQYFLVCVKSKTLSGCVGPLFSARLSWEEGKNLFVEQKITEFGNCRRFWPLREI